MPKIIISDTSCLIVLSKIGSIDLLKQLYTKVIITPEIADEFGEQLPDWFEIRQVRDKFKQQLLEMHIDKGEASAIALALEIENNIIVLDDYKARLVAEKMNLKVTGTLGIIIKAKNSGIVKSIKPYLIKIKKTNFRLSVELEQKALKEANED